MGKISLVLGSIPDWAEAFTGDGYGSGSGSGSGSGYGSGYWRLAALASIARWSNKQKQRLSELGNAFLAFWKSDKNGYPANGGKSTVPVSPGLIETTKGPLRLCQKGTLHATLNPDKWAGDRVWIVALHGDVQHDTDKVGSLKREILGEVK